MAQMSRSPLSPLVLSEVFPIVETMIFAAEESQKLRNHFAQERWSCSVSQILEYSENFWRVLAVAGSAQVDR